MTELKQKPVPKSSLAEKELDRLKNEFDAFDQNVKDLTMDRMNTAPVMEMEPQTKLGSKDIEKSKEIYLKPTRSISSPEKFNENYREKYNFAKEYVHFIAEHKEMIGEPIELWTKPFAGVPAQFWVVPTNKPVWGPRYLAEQIKRKTYHKMIMEQKTITCQDSLGTFHGAMVVDHAVPRLDALPVSTRKSIFMAA